MSLGRDFALSLILGLQNVHDFCTINYVPSVLLLRPEV